jgi:hypothetical protein
VTTTTNDLTAKPPLVEQAVLDDLRRRLRAVNRATLPEGTGWARGFDTDYLTELVSYWADSYDWRVHEERIRSLPWATVDVAGTKYHVLHHKRRVTRRRSCCCTAGRTRCCAMSGCCPYCRISMSSYRPYRGFPSLRR